MQYEIFFKTDLASEKKEYFTKEIEKLFLNTNFVNNLEESFSKEQKIIFSIGGDGTFLEAFNKYGIESLYVPINAGTLGFYTSWNKENLKDLLEDFKLLEAPLIKVSVDNKKFYCINEMTLINPINTQIIEIFINNVHFEHFRGTGICISTPTGSTGYNKSLGGAIINCDNRLFQLVKIAPIDNIKYRTISNSVILNENDEISLPANEYFQNSVMTIDRKSFELSDVEEIKISLSSKNLKILTSDLNFFKRVKNKFIG